MKCANCEAELQDGVRFCPDCGSEVSQNPPELPADPDTDSDGDDKSGKLIQENKKYRGRAQKAEAELEAIKEAQKAKDREGMEEVDRLKLENKELEGFRNKSLDLEKGIMVILEKKMEAIPEERRGLVPEALSVKDRLEWIVTNEKFLMGKEIKTTVGIEQPGSDRGGNQKLKSGISWELGESLIRSIPGMNEKSQDEVNKEIIAAYGANAKPVQVGTALEDE